MSSVWWIEAGRARTSCRTWGARDRPCTAVSLCLAWCGRETEAGARGTASICGLFYSILLYDG